MLSNPMRDIESRGIRADATSVLPRAKAEPERYRGRPLLILLENYVLDSIGELPPEKQQGVAHIVAQVFGGGENKSPRWGNCRRTEFIPFRLISTLGYGFGDRTE